jgi:alpha-beta hydrolase superfamily lysophospholipase
MSHVEGNFRGVRNTNIYYQAWLPEGNVRAVMLLVHGLGEHCGRYMNVVNHFLPLGYAIYGFDHIGHGKSDGVREFVERFEDYTDTLSIFYDLVKDRQTGRLIFLVGHSMGGLIASYFLLDHQAKFQGAVISAPSIKVSDSISRATIVMGKILSIIAPKMGLMRVVDANNISRDPEVVRDYLNDPLVFRGKTPVRLGVELLKAMQCVTTGAEKITLPFIVLQGEDDKIIDPGGAQILYDKARSKDKNIKIYEKLYHEVFNEPERAIVLKDVETWLEAHV